MQQIIGRIVRQILLIGGGAVSANDSDVEKITAAVLVIGTLGWSWIEWWLNNRKKGSSDVQVSNNTPGN